MEVVSKRKSIYASAADVGFTDRCLIWAVSRRELSNIGEVENRKLYRWKNRSTGREGKMARVPRRDGQKCKAIFRAVGNNRYNTESFIERDNAGARIIEGCEQLVKTTANKVIPGKK